MFRNEEIGFQVMSGARSPFAKSCVSPIANPNDIRGICQLHLEHLSARLPIVAAWVIYQVPEGGDRESVAYYAAQAEPFNLALMNYLRGEEWLAHSLVSLQVEQLAIAEPVYVCPFDSYSASSEYLLICPGQVLAPDQIQILEQTGRLLSYYLATSQECMRQQVVTQALEQVVQRVEHQLRNPLALIGLYAENLRLESPTDSLRDQALVIRETVNELSANLTNLIYCGQRSQLRIATYDLRAILLDALKSLQPWIKEKHLTIDYPVTAVPLALDCWQMKQVFSNLLNNAVHFSPHDGSICCDWQVFQREVLIEISDQGPGLSSEDLQHAFTPFYSRRPGGTGLGLAIAKKIILDHQGNLWAKNLPKGGARFSFTLPRSMSA